MTKRKKI